MEILSLLFSIIITATIFVRIITILVDSLILLKESIHKLKNHPDGSQSDLDNK